MTSTDEEAIRVSTGKVMVEIEDGRRAAHRKHGKNSIEAVPASDIARWLPILGEEFGEVNECLTYDKDRGNLRSELVDLATVAVAWIAAIDRQDRYDRLCGVCSGRFGVHRMVDYRCPTKVDGDYNQFVASV